MANAQISRPQYISWHLYQNIVGDDGLEILLNKFPIKVENLQLSTGIFNYLEENKITSAGLKCLKTIS